MSTRLEAAEPNSHDPNGVVKYAEEMAQAVLQNAKQFMQGERPEFVADFSQLDPVHRFAAQRFASLLDIWAGRPWELLDEGPLQSESTKYQLSFRRHNLVLPAGRTIIRKMLLSSAGQGDEPSPYLIRYQDGASARLS